MTANMHAVIGILEESGVFKGGYQWNHGENKEELLKHLKSVKEVRKLVNLAVWEDIISEDEYKAITENDGFKYTRVGNLYVQQSAYQIGMTPCQYENINDCLMCADFVYVYDKKKSSWITIRNKPLEELIHEAHINTQGQSLEEVEVA